MVPDLLRAIRKFRTLSQRELAARAGVPRATVDRLESGRTQDPCLSTLQRLLAGAGMSLQVVDDNGEEISYHNAPDTHRDRAGRHLPAHLERYPLHGAKWGWWGWYRIAWPDDPDPKATYNVPDWIYYLRPRPPRYPR
jgi:transcriptional regulator with XRE-family HTH domain